jgi:hypothetical protein
VIRHLSQVWKVVLGRLWSLKGEMLGLRAASVGGLGKRIDGCL